MVVSVETLTTLLSFAGLLVALAGGFGWVIHRSDGQHQRLGDQLNEHGRQLVAITAQLNEHGRRLDALDERLDEQGRRLDGHERLLVEINGRLSSHERQLVEVTGELVEIKVRLNEHGRQLGDKIDANTRELTEVKIAVARLEGPRPHLIPAR